MATLATETGNPRPWIDHYPPGISWETELDTTPVHEQVLAVCAKNPGGAALDFLGRTTTFGELGSQIEALAGALQTQFGVKRGSRVALMLPNTPFYVVAYYAVLRTGATVVNCNPLYTVHELKHIVSNAGADILVTLDLQQLFEKAEALAEAGHVKTLIACHFPNVLPTIKKILFSVVKRKDLANVKASPVAGKVVWFEDLVARNDKPTPVAVDARTDVAVQQYTGGTTGLPKGAMLTYENARFKTAAAVASNDTRQDDVLLAVAPLYHIAGMLMGVNIPALTGATTVLMYRFDPLGVAQALERHRVSWWYSIAPMNAALMQLPGACDMDWSALRMNPVTSFGITFTEPLAQQWSAFAPHCIAFEAAYGLSETHTMDTCMTYTAIRWGTQGKPVPGNTLRIIDPDTGAELPAGEVGEITILGPGNFKGYWNKPEATAKTLRNGWVHTGDMGKIDADGYLTFIGRTKEMIKVSGYSVFPEEVETLLIKHPAVAQAAVIGVPDAEKGEVVRAFIVKKAGQEVDAAALVAWARENMAPYKAPREVRFIDALPATGAGKVLRRLLKDE